jgi:hypothetical protein
MLNMAIYGTESYIFKFSSLEQSKNIAPGCVSGTMTPGSITACGIQKTGIHFAEDSMSPFSIGDSTLGAEAARLLMRTMTGGRTLETLSGGITNNAYSAATGSNHFPGFMAPALAVVNTGAQRVFLYSNDGENPTDSNTAYPSYPASVSIDITAWSVPFGTTLIHTVTAVGSMGEVTGLAQGPTLSGSVTAAAQSGGVYGIVTIAIPAYAMSMLSAPTVVQVESVLAATAAATVAAGSRRVAVPTHERGQVESNLKPLGSLQAGGSGAISRPWLGVRPQPFTQKSPDLALFSISLLADPGHHNPGSPSQSRLPTRQLRKVQRPASLASACPVLMRVPQSSRRYSSSLSDRLRAKT